MGKTEKELKKALKNQIPAKKNSDSSHKTNIILISIAAVLSIAMIVAVVLLLTSGIKDKNATPDELVSFKSEHYEVDNAMLTYYYTSTFYQFYEQNYYYMQYYYSFDPTQSLSSQYYDQTNSITWHQYFLEAAANNAMQNLYLAEAAYDDGLKLEDEDYERIEQAISNIDTEAATYGLTRDEYIKHLYGDISEESVRSAMELQQLANKQQEALEGTYDLSTEACEEYYSNNKYDYNMVDFMTYDITASVTDDMTEEEKSLAYQKAEETANDIANSETKDEFVEKVYQYMVEQNELLGTDMEDATIRSNAEATAVTEHTYTGDNDVDTWVFDDSRQLGDHTVLSAVDGTYTAYFMTKLQYRNEEETKTVRHILISSTESDDEATQEEAKALADEVYAKWEAAGKTEEGFEKLAEEYNDDSSSLYENIERDQMVTEFNDWCFDESRQPGDCEIVKTDYGYHLIYFVENGAPAWEASVKEDLTSADLQDKLDEYQDKYDVTSYAEKLVKIKDYNAYQAAVLETTAAATDAEGITTDTSELVDTSVDTEETVTTEESETEAVTTAA